MDKKKVTAIIATSTVAMNVTAAKTVLADTINDNNSISAVEDIKNHQAKAIMPTLNGITVNKQLISRNYSKGVIIVPRYIVIHDTDNRRVGANAMANRNYFANHADANASAHYTVDQANIIQCLEDTWRGWHVGDGNNPLINNSNTIGIELCVNADNNFNKTLENGIALTKYLMQKYNIPAERVVRHYDVSRKICPKMMIQDNPGLWTYFKNVISGGSGSSGSTSNEKVLYTGKVVNVTSTLNVRGSANGSSAVVGSLKKDSTVNIYGEENGWYKVAYSSYGETKYGYASKNYITVNSSSVNNGTSSNGSTNSGSTNSGSNSNNTTTSAKKGKVVNVSSSLNVRSSASSSGSVISYLKNGQEVTVNYEENGWYNITFDTKKTGFVSKNYISITNSSGSTTGGSTSSGSNSSSGNSGSSSNNTTTSAKKGKVVNISTSLNVRSSASSSGSVVAQLKNGQEVTVNYEQNGWYNVTFNTNKTGFVSKSYISITSSLGSTTGGNASTGSSNNSGSSNSNTNNNNSSNNSSGTSSVKKGKVVDVSTTLNVRKGAGTNYSVVAYVTNNTEVEILSEQGSWYKIRLKDGKEGYAAKQYINITSSTNSGTTSSGSSVSNESKGKVVNVSTNLNMRKGAGTSYSVVAYLLPGTEVTIKNNSNGWYYIEAKVNGSIKTGYVKTDYIQVIK